MLLWFSQRKEFKMDIIAYITAHASEIIQIVTSVIAAASLIANLTPTDADNAVIATISKFINALALNFKK